MQKIYCIFIRLTCYAGFMIWQTKPEYRDCYFVILNPFNTHFGRCMSIPSLPSLSPDGGNGLWAVELAEKDRTCASHFVYRMEALCFSWQFPKQGTVLRIISLQNFVDGLRESTRILAQCKDPPSPCGTAQQALLPGHSEVRHLFWHPENSFWNMHETREVPIVW